MQSSENFNQITYWQTSTAETLLGFVEHLRRQVNKPLVIVLDNASIHDAAAIRPALALLEKEGVKFESCRLTARSSTASRRCGG